MLDIAILGAIVLLVVVMLLTFLAEWGWKFVASVVLFVFTSYAVGWILLFLLQWHP